MNEPPEALLLCLIATMAYFHCCGARGRIFHCSFCSAQRLRPYDCNAPGRRKLVGVLLGRKAGGAHFSQAQPFSFGFGRKSLAFRTKPDHLAMVERRDRHERMFAEAKKKGRTPAEDPRKAKYAKLVKRTNDKYRRIAEQRGILCEKE